ncbi:unnamed protein product, partial [Iphiclides podalirius]
MSSPTHVFNVEMTCEGCSGAVERVLNRLKGQGVNEVTISLPEQRVLVNSSLSADQLLEQAQRRKASHKVDRQPSQDGRDALDASR